jgi:hypothetical protein
MNSRIVSHWVPRRSIRVIADLPDGQRRLAVFILRS